MPQPDLVQYYIVRIWIENTSYFNYTTKSAQKFTNNLVNFIVTCFILFHSLYTQFVKDQNGIGFDMWS